MLALTLSAIGCGSAPKAADMAVVHDMSMPDMTQKTCGDIIMCLINSGGGTGGLGGLGACGQGASSAAQMQAQQLGICFLANCLSTLQMDGGAGGTTAVAMCLAQKCPTQLAGCQGLGL
jgi:hypothetical protein